MDYPRLGRTGLKVSRLSFGTARFGEIDDRTAADLVAAAVDYGVSTFDTADAYNAGASESQLGPLLTRVRDRVVLCTKVGLRVGDSEADYSSTSRDDAARWARGIGPNDDGLSRKHIITAAEASLRRLQTDYIDLYQVHRFDPDTPLEETLSVLDDLIRAGKVRYAGCSGFTADQLGRALETSSDLRLCRFASMQTNYSLAVRRAEADILPLCLQNEMGVLAFGSVAGGMLSGRFQPGDAPPGDSRLGSREVFKRLYMTPENFALVDRLGKAARDTGRSVAQLAAGWVASQRGVTSVLVGFSKLDQLKDMVHAIDNPLTTEEMDLVSGQSEGSDAPSEAT